VRVSSAATTSAFDSVSIRRRLASPRFPMGVAASTITRPLSPGPGPHNYDGPMTTGPEREFDALVETDTAPPARPTAGEPGLASADPLTDRGLRRVVCEGGPSLLEAVVAADLLDEADITLSPVFAGTSTTPRTDGPDEVARFDLVHLITAEGFVMARYVRPGRS